MPIASRVLQIAAVLGAVLGAAPAFAFDGTQTTPAQGRQITSGEAFRSGAEALKVGEKAKAIDSFEFAASKGHPIAQWQLGRMYAKGDGVPQDDLRAFKYFSAIADDHADDTPGTYQARVTASAFVALGHYYLEGIPTKLKSDPGTAFKMFGHAASYFGDADAQYYLAQLYLDGVGTERDARQAARWLMRAANKGQLRAQAALGSMMFTGEAMPRQAARGLMWLMLAKDSAKDAQPSDQIWITKLYDSAVAQATDDERQIALVYLERWLKGNRD